MATIIHATLDNLRVATANVNQLTDQVKPRPWTLARIRRPKDPKVAR
jgi:hypothetical protein